MDTCDYPNCTAPIINGVPICHHPQIGESVRTLRSDDMLKLAEVLNVDAVRITYEVSSHEMLHPDPNVSNRMREIGLSDCGYGCKVYADPRSNVRVLAHNSAYGCPK